MATVEITKDNLETTIENNDVVFLDFWAPWCAPCRTFGPVFESASDDHSDIVFGKINTEDQPELAGSFGITSIPTLIAFKEKIGVFSQPGALPPAALSELIGKIREVDMDEVRAHIAAEESKGQ